MRNTVKFKFGGKKGKERTLTAAKDLVVVRIKDDESLEKVSLGKKNKNFLDSMDVVHRYQPLGIYVLRIKGNAKLKQRDRARNTLAKENDVQFVGKVFCQEDKTPVLYTENGFLKFHEGISEEEQKSLLDKYNLGVKEKSPFSPNAYFVKFKDGYGSEIFDTCLEILSDDRIEYCHPELIHIKDKKEIHPRQWHLKPSIIGGKNIDSHVNVEAAWGITKGEGVIIAIIDDAIDIRHQDFNTPNKIVSPYNAFYQEGTPNAIDPSPTNFGESHGTSCAGVACASGQFKASGVAPAAKLMPIKLPPDLGSYKEANAIYYAVKNGADIISCSWGPSDGKWYDSNDPRHLKSHYIPDHTREALKFAVEKGRSGKGCLIVWAAGNGNESADLDEYSNNEYVLAIAASNSKDTKSIYSDYGESIFCAFPSNDFVLADNGEYYYDNTIWTTDGSKYGYNPALLENNHIRYDYYDDTGNYTSAFGGTSSAAPGVAGIIALILSANPSLTHNQVKDVLRGSCIRIDLVGGQYNSEGRSKWYGYGKPDAGAAVKLASEFNVSDNSSNPILGTSGGVEDENNTVLSPFLRLGDTGEFVTVLQSLLNKWGYGLSVDSFFGRMTMAAIIDFQSSNVDKHGEPLVVDGVVGPLTWWSLRNPKEVRLLDPSFFTSLPDARFGGSEIAKKALNIAIEEINLGAKEEGGNNKGEFVKKYLVPANLEPPLPWCAAFVSWCFLQAVDNHQDKMPFDYSVGAKSIYKSFKRKGWAYDLESGIEPQPGDIVVWHRGNPQSWEGHIGLVHHVKDGFIYTIEGNRTSKVQGFRYVSSRMNKLLGFGRVNLSPTERNDIERFFLYS